jgi:hypothetical protein
MQIRGSTGDDRTHPTDKKKQETGLLVALVVILVLLVGGYIALKTS